MTKKTKLLILLSVAMLSMGKANLCSDTYATDGGINANFKAPAQKNALNTNSKVQAQKNVTNTNSEEHAQKNVTNPNFKAQAQKNATNTNYFKAPAQKNVTNTNSKAPAKVNVTNTNSEVQAQKNVSNTNSKVQAQKNATNTNSKAQAQKNVTNTNSESQAQKNALNTNSKAPAQKNVSSLENVENVNFKVISRVDNLNREQRKVYYTSLVKNNNLYELLRQGKFKYVCNKIYNQNSDKDDVEPKIEFKGRNSKEKKDLITGFIDSLIKCGFLKKEVKFKDEKIYQVELDDFKRIYNNLIDTLESILQWSRRLERIRTHVEKESAKISKEYMLAFEKLLKDVEIGISNIVERLKKENSDLFDFELDSDFLNYLHNMLLDSTKSVRLENGKKFSMIMWCIFWNMRKFISDLHDCEYDELFGMDESMKERFEALFGENGYYYNNYDIVDSLLGCDKVQNTGSFSTSELDDDGDRLDGEKLKYVNNYIDRKLDHLKMPSSCRKIDPSLNFKNIPEEELALFKDMLKEVNSVRDKLVGYGFLRNDPIRDEIAIQIKYEHGIIIYNKLMDLFKTIREMYIDFQNKGEISNEAYLKIYNENIEKLRIILTDFDKVVYRLVGIHIGNLFINYISCACLSKEPENRLKGYKKFYEIFYNTRKFLLSSIFAIKKYDKDHPELQELLNKWTKNGNLKECSQNELIIERQNTLSIGQKNAQNDVKKNVQKTLFKVEQFLNKKTKRPGE